MDVKHRTAAGRMGTATHESEWFPFYKIEASVDTFFAVFIAFYAVVATIIAICSSGASMHLFTFTTISSVLAIPAMLFDSKWLRAILWAMLPVVVVATMRYALSGWDIATFVVIHLADYIVLVYLVYALARRGRGCYWWQVAVGGMLWAAYACFIESAGLVELLTPPELVPGWYPYSYFGEFIQIIVYGTAAMTLMFYAVNAVNGDVAVSPAGDTVVVNSVVEVRGDGGDFLCLDTGRQVASGGASMCIRRGAVPRFARRFSWDKAEGAYCTTGVLRGRQKLCLDAKLFEDIAKKK